MESKRCAGALARADLSSPAPAGGVVYESRGVVLVIGERDVALDAGGRLAATTSAVVFAPAAAAPVGAPHTLTVVGGRVTRVTGHLGAFRAHAALPDGGEADIGGFSPNRDGAFDLVLDLGDPPLVRRSVLPLGYAAPGPAPDAIERACTQLAGLQGRFSKPQFFRYDQTLCAHGGGGLVGCTRCLTTCGAEAIRSAGDRIEVDPYLCQGCGACTLACPTGALSYTAPSLRELRRRVEEEIANARAASAGPPVLVVHSPTADDAGRFAALPTATRAIEVPTLAAFGEELWFGALAAGAAAVVLVDDGTMPEDSRSLLTEHIALARTLLRAVGGDDDAIVLTDASALERAVGGALARPARSAAGLPYSSRKRAALLEAIDALGGGPDGEVVPLAAGTPLGDVVVDRDRCTLCFACVNLCPTRALVADETDSLRLSFVEAACVQCGLCEIACPEKAVRLVPRFDPDPACRGAPRLLSETDHARCIECGTPFISRKVLESSLARIADHPALRGEGLHRMQMCPACRQRTMLDPAG